MWFLESEIGFWSFRGGDVGSREGRSGGARICGSKILTVSGLQSGVRGKLLSPRPNLLFFLHIFSLRWQSRILDRLKRLRTSEYIRMGSRVKSANGASGKLLFIECRGYKKLFSLGKTLVHLYECRKS